MFIVCAIIPDILLTALVLPFCLRVCTVSGWDLMHDVGVR